MKNILSKIILCILLFSVLSFSVQISTVSSQSTENRSASFPATRGSNVQIDATLTHEGGGSNPVLLKDTEYQLTIEVTLGSLGNDTEDIHDFEFEISITTDSLLSSKSIFNAYYFDPQTRLDQQGSNKIYEFPVLITGQFDASTANLDILFKLREAVDNLPDPTTEFDNLGFQIDINPNPDASVVELSGSSTDHRERTPLTDENTQVNFQVDLSHEGLYEGKPSMNSGNYYDASVNITLISLGTDAVDIHDLELEILMEDVEITDYIPGNDPVRYFSAYAIDTIELVNGESVIFDFILQPFTNINNTEVELSFKLSFKEDVSLVDPTTESEIVFEIPLNPNVEGLNDDDVPFNFYYGLVFFIIVIPIISKKRKSSKF